MNLPTIMPRRSPDLKKKTFLQVMLMYKELSMWNFSMTTNKELFPNLYKMV